MVNDHQDDMLKVMKVLKVQHSKSVELMGREAQTLIQLRDSRVPRVETDGYFTIQLQDYTPPLRCLVMEKIKGQDLERWVSQDGCVPFQIALDWLRQLAKILEQLHQHQLIHRDIKPSNIILKPSGQLVLIDFGAVRQVTETVIGEQAVTSVVTVGYAAPEQYHGRVYPQSDFFALGRTFVHLLTGRYPADIDEQSGQSWRDNLPQTLTQKSVHPLTLRQVHRLLDCVDWLMEPRVEDRPPEARAILAELNHIKAVEPSALPLPKLIVAGVGLVAFGIGIGMAIPWQQLPGSEGTRTVTSQSCQGWPPNVTEMTFDPDGQYLAWGSSDGSLWFVELDAVFELDRLDSLNCQRYPSHEDGVAALRFSPDGQRLASASLDGTINPYLMNSDHDSSRLPLLSRTEGLLRALNPLRPNWLVITIEFSPDSQYLATGTNEGRTTIWNLNTSTQSDDLKPAYRGYVTSLSFNRTGSHLVTTSLKNRALIRLWQSQETIELPQDNVSSATFSPQEETNLATLSADSTVQVWDVNRPEAAIAQFQPRDRALSIQFSPDGQTLAILRSTQVQLWKWRQDPGGQAAQQLPSEQDVAALAFSPQGGKYIATVSTNNWLEVWQTEDLSKVGSRAMSVPLTHVTFHPQVAADGTVTLAVANMSGKVKLCQLSPHGNLACAKILRDS